MLTVCLSNYNHGHFLQKRIASLLAGMPEDAQFLITDDGSTDDSLDILKAFADKDKRIHLIVNEKNRGVIPSINAMLDLVQGEFVSFIAADDVHDKEFYPALLKLTKDYPGYGVYVSDFAFSRQGKIHEHPLVPGAKDVMLLKPEQLPKFFGTSKFWIPGHSSIFKTSLVREFKRFEPSLRHHCDWLINHGAALKGGVVFLPQLHSVWRLDGGNYSDANECLQRETVLSIIQFLNRKENRQWRVMFRRSHLLWGFIKPNFLFFCLRPQCWDYLFFIFLRILSNRLKFKAKASLNCTV